MGIAGSVSRGTFFTWPRVALQAPSSTAKKQELHPSCLPKDAEGSMWTRGSAEIVRGLVGQEIFGLESELGNHCLE